MSDAASSTSVVVPSQSLSTDAVAQSSAAPGYAAPFVSSQSTSADAEVS